MAANRVSATTFLVLAMALLLATAFLALSALSQIDLHLALPKPQIENAALPMPLPPLSEHAKVKHGTDALLAWEYINAHGKFCRLDDCPDEHVHYGCQMDDGRYAVAVVIEQVSTVTAFVVSDRGAAARFNDGCTNPWLGVHP